jgi:DNA-directed RNA polymerase subunit RPC12/RpoP
MKLKNIVGKTVYYCTTCGQEFRVKDAADIHMEYKGHDEKKKA